MRRSGLVVSLLLGACTTGRAEVEVRTEVAPEPSVAEPSAQPEPDAALPLDPRSSYELAAAIGEALQEPSFTREQALAEVRSGWRGRRYRWQVGVASTLCRRADACNVFPFDHAEAQTRIVAGWLPNVVLSKADHTGLLARCGAGLCVATVEATLSGFVLSPDDPTSLTFTDVSVLDVRARRAEESWVRRRADPRVATLRTRHAGR